MKKCFFSVFAVVVVNLVLVMGCSPDAHFVPKGELQKEQHFGVYTVRTYRESFGPGASLTIARKGTVVYAKDGFCFFSMDDVPGEDTRIRMGDDITGDGEPNLVIEHWSGGAHCCFDYYIFSIGDDFRLLDIIETQHGCKGFEDVDGDGALELDALDWTFAYWKACFAASPAPRVILKFRDGKYRVAPELMRTTPPSEDEERTLAEAVAQDESWNQGNVPPALWGHMLDLMYSGHAPLAWEFFDQAWPEGFEDKFGESKEQFKADFLHAISQSPYWPAIKKAFYSDGHGEPGEKRPTSRRPGRRRGPGFAP